MYEKYYGLKEKPFSILPDPDFLYWSKSHRLAFAMLQYGVLNRAGFTVITGDVGCGKTTLVRHLLNRLGEDVTVALLSNTPDEDSDLLEWILMAFGQPFESGSSAVLYEQFRQFMIKEYSKGKRTLLIVDEAQNLGVQALEKLRMLSNINADKDQLLQLILVGQPQLKDLLRQPNMVQFVQRISSDFHLSPLTLNEMIDYVAHRLKVAGGSNVRCFTLDSCRKIHKRSRGIPRLVNILCDTAMVYGFARDKKQITADIVGEVIRDKLDHGVFGFGATAGDGAEESQVNESVVGEPASPSRSDGVRNLSSVLKRGQG